MTLISFKSLIKSHLLNWGPPTLIIRFLKFFSLSTQHVFTATNFMVNFFFLPSSLEYKVHRTEIFVLFTIVSKYPAQCLAHSVFNKYTLIEWMPVSLFCMAFLPEIFSRFLFKIFLVVYVLIFLLSVFILILFFFLLDLVIPWQYVSYCFKMHQGFCFYLDVVRPADQEMATNSETVGWLLTKLTVEIILQSVHISDHHVVHLKLIQCYVSVTSQ